MNEKQKDIIRKIMILFLLIQPAFDIYMTIVGTKLDILGYSIVTIIRMAVISIIALLFVIESLKTKTNLLQTKVYLAYIGVVILYFICHNLVIYLSDGYYIKNNLYDFLTEANYIFRLTMPMTIIYDFLIIKINKKDVINILITVGLSIAVVILLSDLFGVGFISYDYDNTQISDNIFSWFNSNKTYDYEKITCKGFFYSANQISILLSIIYLVITYKILKEDKWKLSIILAVMTITMLLIGTRVGTYMPILISIFMLILYLVTSILYKKKTNTKCIIAILVVISIWFIFFLYAPQRNRQFADDIGKISSDQLDELENKGQIVKVENLKKIFLDREKMLEYIGIKESSETNESLIYQSKCKFIAENYEYHYISSQYINVIYPYKDDPDFWLEVFQMPIYIKADNRGLEPLIAKEIQKNDSNLFKYLFGIGATPLNIRGFMIEKDIVSHYYNLGIIGTIIFIGPYFFVLIISLKKAFDELIYHKKIRFGTTNIFSIALMMILILSYNSGHALDEFIIFTYICLIASNILNNFLKEFNKEVDKCQK